MQNVICRH